MEPLTPKKTDSVLLRELLFAMESSRSRRVRSMRDFAESEIFIPDGEYSGLRYKTSRQPYSAVYFALVESRRFRRIVATGPTQSGKTLTAFIIPSLYHLFEIGETIVCGVPDLDIVADKWNMDFLPVIEATKYREFLPMKGGGARGGVPKGAVKFQNGAVLRFMTGGGGDKSRSHFTSRVLVITETDGFDKVSATSREADQITQLEGRVKAAAENSMVYMECTVSTELGRTYREYSSSTATKIMKRCPYCRAWVCPDRDHLIGWKESETKMQAMRNGVFVCPECSHELSQDDRRIMCAGSVACHSGQYIDNNGVAIGDVPDTDTLGFRWNAFDNQFWTPGYIAGDEWAALHSDFPDIADRGVRQFVWALPYIPEKIDLHSVTASTILKRAAAPRKGILPSWTENITVGMDIGKMLCHWVVMAWDNAGTGHVVDYGRIEVVGWDKGAERAIQNALFEFKEMMLEGFPKEGTGEILKPDQCWIDSAYMTDVIYSWASSAGSGFSPVRGLGMSKERAYTESTLSRKNAAYRGDHYHFARVPSCRIPVVEIDSDHWKKWLHIGLQTEIGQPGAITLHQVGNEKDHMSLAQHLTSEREVQEFIAGKGFIKRWEVISRNNHFFDAAYIACAAGSYCGVRRGIIMRRDKKQVVVKMAGPIVAKGKVSVKGNARSIWSNR